MNWINRLKWGNSTFSRKWPCLSIYFPIFWSIILCPCIKFYNFFHIGFASICITNATTTIQIEPDIILSNLQVVFNLICTLTLWEKCQLLFPLKRWVLWELRLEKEAHTRWLRSIILGLASWLPLSGTCAAHWKHSVDSLVKNQFQGLQYPKTCRWLEKNGLHYIMIILTLYRFWKRCMLLSTLLLVINGWLLLQLPEFLSPFSIPHWCPFPDFMSPNVCITEVSI